MKIAFLILCHKNSSQINKLIDVLDDKDVGFYIHVDKKSNIIGEIKKSNNIYILEDEKRLDIKWGQNQMIHATINLIEAALKSKLRYDYYWLISGQDFPIKSIDYIKDWLNKSKQNNYIDLMAKNDKVYKRFLKRNELKYAKFMPNQNIVSTAIKHFYILITGGPNKTILFKRKNTTGLDFNFGSSWWILNYDCIKYIYEKIMNNSEILKYYDNCICPDESLFQSLFVSSPFKQTQCPLPVLIDWRGQNRHPKTFKIDDYDELMRANYLLARKFDEKIDNTIIKKLYDKLK